MLKLLKPLPRNIVVALSGGVDSMAAVDFLRRKHTVTAAFYHHGTPHSDLAADHVADLCAKWDIPLLVGWLHDPKPPQLSHEEWWRERRYAFLDSLGTSLGPVVTAHHLQDSIETYLWGALNGTPKVIPHRRGNVVRPFLTTRKEEFVDWCVRHGVEWCEDKSNTDTSYTRNKIRHQLLPAALEINPGIHKVVKRIIDKQLATVDNITL